MIIGNDPKYQQAEIIDAIRREHEQSTVPPPQLDGVKLNDPVAAVPNQVSLRDMFAIAVLSGLSANPDFKGDAKHYATRAYIYADAMLEERGQK